MSIVKYKVPGSPDKECASASEQTEPSENVASVLTTQNDTTNNEPEALEGNAISEESAQLME